MEFWQFLAASCVMAFVTRGRAFAVGVALLCNWAVLTCLATASGSQTNWLAMASVDYVSALLILMVQPNRWTATIALLYAVELIAHVAFGISSQGPWPQYRYWYVLFYASWAQAWLLFTWAGIDGGKVVRDRFDLGRGMGDPDAMRHRLGVRRSGKRD